MLARKLDAVRASLVHFTRAFADARSRRPELAPFATTEDLAAALDATAGGLAEARYALIAALVAEHRLGLSTLWGSLLIVAFQPMLLRIRTRMGRLEQASVRRRGRSSPRDEERDARVLAAFVEAVSAVAARDVGLYAVVAIHRATQKALAPERRADRRSAEQDDAFDEDLHTPCTPHALNLGDARVEAAWAKAHEEKLASLFRAARSPLPVERRSAA